MQKTIESIQKQTYTNFEVWIIDGKSSQETHNYLQDLKYPFQFLSEKDSGIYEAMNKGIFLSKGEWIYFLGSGDILAENAILDDVSREFSSDFKIVFGNIRYEKQVFNSSFSMLLWIKNTLHHQGIFYHQSLFKKYAYSTKYQILSDYEFNLKLFIQKITAKKISKTVAICNQNGVSKKYNWGLYAEEINFKTALSSVFFYPFFLIVGVGKFLIRKNNPL